MFGTPLKRLGQEQISGASRANKHGQLAGPDTGRGEAGCSAPQGDCSWAPPSPRVAGGRGQGKTTGGKPHCRAPTKCHPRARSSHVLSTPRLSALPRPRAGIGALAFGLEGMLVATMTLAGSPGARGGKHLDFSESQGSELTAHLHLTPVILPPFRSSNMRIPQAWLPGCRRSVPHLPLWYCLALPLTCPPKPGAVLPPPWTFHFCYLSSQFCLRIPR